MRNTSHIRNTLLGSQLDYLLALTFPLEYLDKASLKHQIHMLKDMGKLAKKEIINLWISFVFLKTTCPTFRYQQSQFGFLFIITRTGTHFQHCCIKSTIRSQQRVEELHFFSTNGSMTKNRWKTPSRDTMKVERIKHNKQDGD